MPVTVKINPNATCEQAYVIPDATPENDGVMTKAQAAKLAGSSGGGGATPYPTPADFPAASSVPGSFAIDNSTGGLYCSFGGSWCFMLILSP